MAFNFKKWNNYGGWLLFIIASVVYLLTMERHLSFWDCGEYIVSSAKLGVTHAPGAALFQIIGAVWSGLAFGDGSKYAVLINSMSAVCSGLTIMFLFWTITHFVRRMFTVNKVGEESINVYTKTLSKSQIIVTIGSGIIGASAFMFSDSFWFSATEGEVYAMASLFTAIILWLGCKWEEEADDIRSNRWLILISLIIGLSIGVHLMAMLALPAVCYLYYVRHYKITLKTFIIANVIILAIFGFVFKMIFPMVMTFFGRTEMYVVNNFGMPFNSGSAVAAVVLIIVFWLAIHYTRKYQLKLINTLVLSIMFMLIGFSSWMVIPIRANANPHMNLNDPDTALGMLDYFNREQYGSWPIFYGEVYTASIADDGMVTDANGNYKFTVRGSNYVKDNKIGKYIKVSDRKEYVYNEKYVKFFPKMFNTSPDVMENYAALYGFPEFSLNPSFFNNPEDYPEEKAQKKAYAQKIYNELATKRENGSIKIADLQKYAQILNIEPPTFGQQINYFMEYQVGYMFLRYFMWNFSGKQNDWEGHLEVTKGNWISGIPFIDNWRLGDQSKLPKIYKENKGRNVYFMLPLILGFIGFFVQLNRNVGHWWALVSLFLLTSVGIIFYTSVKPFEPRERDYALVSAFYVFAIWIGLGVQSLYVLLTQLKKQELKPSIAIAIPAICLAVPLLMGFQNWDDHDRSKREAAYSLAYNYLKGLDKNSILFVYGDNDTYPLWGLQETENFRDDVKIVNYTLLGSPWNMEQVHRKTYNAEGIPHQLEPTQYQLNTNDNIIVVADRINGIFNELKSIIKPNETMSIAEILKLPASELTKHLVDENYDPEGIKSLYNTIEPLSEYLDKDSMTAKEAMAFILDNKNPAKKAIAEFLGYPLGAVNYLPVNKIIVPVNKENAIKSGIVSAKDADRMEDYLTINIANNQLYKAELAMIDMLANYNWDRAIYFSGGGISDPNNTFYLNDYLQYDGLSYKLVPIYSKFGKNGIVGQSNTEQLLKNFNQYKWANYNNPKASFTETDRNYTNAYRNIAVRLAEDLIAEGKKTEAKKVLDTIMEKIPIEPRYDFGYALSRIAPLYQKLGETSTAEKLFNVSKQNVKDRIVYLESLAPHLRYTVSNDLADARSDLSLVLYNQVEAYMAQNDSVKALKVFKEEYEPIKKKLENTYQTYSKDGSINAQEEADIASQFRVINEILSIGGMIDSVYAENESEKIYNLLTKE